MYNVFESESPSLQHFGIKGQKWGVRRFETESGHLTAAGKARYDDYEYAKSETAKAKEKFKQANAKANSTFSQQDLEAANKAKGLYDLRKKQESDAKAKFKMNERAEAGKKIGKREQKLIEKFKEKGMSQEEAEVAAYKRAKLEKALAIGATVTIAAAAAYGAKKYHDYVADEVLEVGKTKFKRITEDGSDKLYDQFYAAGSKKDQNRYVGWYGNQIKGQLGGANKQVYQKTIDLKENIKIASDKNAKNTAAEVLKNTSPENRRQLLDSLSDLKSQYKMIGALDSKQGKMLSKGLDDIAAGRYDTKAAYDVFNFDVGNRNVKVYDEFRTALKNKGYSGIKDRNDAKYSGYNANSARIIFDNSKVKVSDIRKVSDSEIQNQKAKEDAREINRQLLQTVGKYGLATAGLLGAAKASSASGRNKENTKAIADYKKEHPNTKLSNDEILENYYGGK